jgi:hypothetical protein
MKRRINPVRGVSLERTPTVPPREFVRIWQTSATVAEVARKVGRTKNACRVRAYRYRTWWGVPLKDFPPIEVELTDWDELAEYAETLGNGKAEAHQIEAV